MKFLKKTALVTGASRGIGREIAIALAREGAEVILLARTVSELEETQRSIGKPCTLFPFDLTADSTFTEVEARLKNKSVDIFVHAAGAWHNKKRIYHGTSFSDTHLSEVNEVLNVGLLSSIRLTHAVIPMMTKNKSGKIIFVSCCFNSPEEAKGWLHYYLSNRSIEQFAIGLSAELREHEIQVNCVAPRYVATDALREFLPDYAGRAIGPSEVARTSVFLASSDADHITGQIFKLWDKRDY